MERLRAPEQPKTNGASGDNRPKRKIPQDYEGQDDRSGATEQPSPDPSLRKYSKIMSKYQKSVQRAAAAAASAHIESNQEESDPVEPHELHDLVPIPQPARLPTPEYRPSFSTLPLWMEEPSIVPSTKRAPFADLGVGDKTAAHLRKQGFSEAFAVQCALIPRLMYRMGRSHSRPNDVCVSAPTGSGKTLGYALPVVESLRRHQDTCSLRAVVVVPTRELADQAITTFRKCMAGSQLKIATSIGNQSFTDEQAALVKREKRYDHALDTMPFHVPKYESAIDILVCTPGRLVEHVQNTLGFNLDYLEWLIIDEADRLLDQSFQDWVKHINKALDKDAVDEIEAHFMPSIYKKTKRYVRKIILSATMTRDISKLAALKLRRPTLIEVRTEGEEGQARSNNDGDETLTAKPNGQYELPGGLSEVAIPVGDGSEKPLFLLQWLAEVFGSTTAKAADVLVFAASTSEAHRLHHLLSSLLPSIVSPCPPIMLLTRIHTSLSSALTNLSSTRPRIIISTDRASRGLDLPLSHVLNYTVPRSLESYVHRVGRTARAGRQGEAWSMVRDVEARWFWNEIAKTGMVQRSSKVSRKKLTIGQQWKEGTGKEAYRRVLDEMSKMVEDKRGAKK
ncbi:hypothetical protein ANO11243_088460 [Dothideomycetidae sp. 11243]|nr:hypothetical protein ANO11243_088460 [fungal sp. No.11243]